MIDENDPYGHMMKIPVFRDDLSKSRGNSDAELEARRLTFERETAEIEERRQAMREARMDVVHRDTPNSVKMTYGCDDPEKVWTEETTPEQITKDIESIMLGPETRTPQGIDPKGEAGATKLPLRSIPWAVVLEASLGTGEGSIKYGLHNWRESGGVETMTYIEAAQRHLIAYILGEDLDPDTGLPHITKAIASLMVVRDAMIHGVATDNRPPAAPPELIEALTYEWGKVRTNTKPKGQVE